MCTSMLMINGGALLTASSRRSTGSSSAATTGAGPAAGFAPGLTAFGPASAAGEPATWAEGLAAGDKVGLGATLMTGKGETLGAAAHGELGVGSAAAGRTGGGAWREGEGSICGGPT